MTDSSKCGHDFEVVGTEGKYIRKKCRKCPRVVLVLDPKYQHYYKVRPDGCAWSGFGNVGGALAEVGDLIRCDDDDECIVTIEKVLMTQEEIDALPEFAGY